MAVRGADYREVDGPLVAEARLPLSADHGVQCSVLVDGPILEVCVNDQRALTYRIDEGGENELGAFAVDGEVACRLAVHTDR